MSVDNTVHPEGLAMALSKILRRARTKQIDLSEQFNWPRRVPADAWWQDIAGKTRSWPKGQQESWGLPFLMAPDRGANVIIAAARRDPVTVALRGKATHVCVLHSWAQMPKETQALQPREGRVVAEYMLEYTDGTSHTQPLRARFEVDMSFAESPGPTWLAQWFNMPRTIDPTGPVPDRTRGGRLQCGIDGGWGTPLHYAMPNPHPEKTIRSLTIRGLTRSPLLVAGITLYRGTAHPLAHLPRRTYRVVTPGGTPDVEAVDVDLGIVTRMIATNCPRGRKWLSSPGTTDPEAQCEQLIQVVGAEDATVSVQMRRKGKQVKRSFSLGDAFQKGRSKDRDAALEILGKQRQWMQIRVIDKSTGQPTPVRIHMSGARGEYVAPYGHHEQVNTNWFEDYGADVVWSGRNYAYVPGVFTSDMPVGDLYIEICKGYEYKPVRCKVAVRPGQKTLELKIERWKDLRKEGWVTADTHVHFISPHTAWLEGQAEGVNVVNLLASQWGRLFTNVGDYTGRVGVAEDDTIVYVGTENRNHMLGHMSMLGTKGPLPVFPMCCGGPGESWVGDPDFMMLADWALENKRKGGVVIRPHYPYCGHTEDPVPIIKGLVDALEINMQRQSGFPMQEWYRYLNCGYRVAVCGGTDKMGAYCPVGWMRTYAKLNPNRPFTYDAWGAAVRAGRTTTTNGPLIDLQVDGKNIGDTIRMTRTGGSVEVAAVADCFWPLETLEVVHNGRVVAQSTSSKGSTCLRLTKRVKITGSGWLAARCYGLHTHAEASRLGAHTSPVYVKCGQTRAFDGPAAEHMLALVQGGMEYLNTIATAFDEPTRKRMVKQFREVQEELKVRLTVEHAHHHGDGNWHTH